MAGLLAVALTGLTVPGSSADPGPDDTVLGIPADPGSLGAIPDGATGCTSPPTATRDLTFTVPTRPERITDIEVGVTLTHTWVGDLTFELIAPGGTPSFTIFSHTQRTNATGCGSSTNLDGEYIFSDQHVGDWWAAATGTTMPPGAFRSSETGGDGATGAPTMMTPPFATVPPGGTWTLRISDTGGGDTGAVTAAYLALTVDTTAPATLVAGPPSHGKLRHRPAYELSSPDTDVDGFMCRVDNSSWEPCTSPFTPQVRQGRHSIKVVAFDTSTNVDPSAEMRSFYYQTKKCATKTKKFKKAKRAYNKAKQRGDRKAIKKAKYKYKKAKKQMKRACR